MILVYHIDSYLSVHTDKDDVTFNAKLLFSYFSRSVYFIFISTGYFFFWKFIKERKMKEFEHQNTLNLLIKQEQTDRKLTEARNAFLLAQINPHFLFNTLNYIYYLTYKTSPEGAKGILALSKMMRYTANSNNTNPYIYLSTEIEYVETLIYLHQMRNKQLLRFDFVYKKNTKMITIIPLVLITIVENMFKYGDLANEFSPSIKIEKDGDGYLVIETRNAVKFSKRYCSLGSGLKNVNERLKFAYSGRAKLVYSKDKLNRFHLTATIPIN